MMEWLYENQVLCCAITFVIMIILDIIVLIFKFKKDTSKEVIKDLIRKVSYYKIQENAHLERVKTYYKKSEMLLSFIEFLKKENNEYLKETQILTDEVPELKGRRILLQCSDFDTLKKLRNILLGFGCDVDLAFSKDDIIFCLDDLELDYNFIITDILDDDIGLDFARFYKTLMECNNYIILLNTNKKNKDYSNHFHEIINIPLNTSSIKKKLLKLNKELLNPDTETTLSDEEIDEISKRYNIN